MDTESDYVQYYCAQEQGQIEYRLPDRTRVDCLTDSHAIEFDWCRKWAESIGQALYYSKMTGKAPKVALICRENEARFVQRFQIAAPSIDVVIIPVSDANAPQSPIQPPPPADHSPTHD